MSYLINPFISFPSSQWDYEDDMDYATQAAFDAVWVPDNTKVDGNPVTKKLDIVADVNAQNDVVYYDATSTSDTNNIWRFILDITTITTNTVFANEHGVYILLSDNTSGSTVSNDCYGLLIVAQSNSGDTFYALDSNNQRPDSSTWIAFSTTPTATTYGLQGKRTSATSATMGLYNTDFTTLTEEEVITVSSNMQSLRYLKAIARTQTTNGNITLTLDDFRLMKTQDTPP